jgi:glycosyltransferase involved in cell wall biosynthesis
MNIYTGNNGHILIQRMKPIVEKLGHNFISSTQKNCDVYLAFIRFEEKSNLPKVVRIDGIYYDLAKNYKEKNVGISDAHSKSDAVIYQSNSSKKMCEFYLSPTKKNCKKYIIHNGIQKFWAGNPEKHDGINIIVSSKWRRHKRLKEIIEIFLDFQKVIPDSRLHILGKLHDNKEVKHSKIKYYGMISHEQMKSIMRISDISLHLSKRDSCPNSVVETISMGIPVITTNSCGGATEMCLLTKGCIVVDGDGNSNDIKECFPYSDKWNEIKINVKENIINNMTLISKNKTRCEFPESLTIEYCTKQYLQVLEGVIKH